MCLLSMVLLLEVRHCRQPCRLGDFQVLSWLEPFGDWESSELRLVTLGGWVPSKCEEVLNLRGPKLQNVKLFSMLGSGEGSTCETVVL